MTETRIFSLNHCASIDIYDSPPRHVLSKCSTGSRSLIFIPRPLVSRVDDAREQNFGDVLASKPYSYFFKCSSVQNLRGFVGREMPLWVVLTNQGMDLWSDLGHANFGKVYCSDLSATVIHRE
ncbi:hypothetical protein YC2023_088042 [Brassica napus]